MKILITGGAGFIGGHLTEALLRSGHQVAVMDDLSTGRLENLTAVKDHPRLKVSVDDVITSPRLEEMIRDCDCIFHLAAAVGVELVVHDPVRTIMTNVKGTERILSLSAQLGKRCILASTSEVYGKSTRPRFSESDDLLIGPPTHSRWSYACSKLLDEFLLMAYQRNCGLFGTVVRFFNTVGPRQTGRYGMVLPRFVSAALAGEPLKVYGSGEQTRCFCHVADTVRALEMLIPLPEEQLSGRIFNIGSSRSVSIRELAEMVIQRTGSSSPLEYVPYSEAYEAGFEDMLHRAPDCEKIKTVCGWQAEIPLENIIDDVATSMRA